MKILKIKSVLSTVALLAGVCVAQTLPYTGEVTGDNVYIRSEPNMASYAVTKVSAPTRVIVEKKFADSWLAIRPVSGCYGVVSKNLVDTDASGKNGTINASNVRLRAAGRMRTTDFHSVLCKLQKGDKVRIVGYAEDDKGPWYIVKPTGKALFYISAKFVKKVDDEVAEKPAENKVETDKMVGADAEPKPAEKEVTVVEEEKITEIPLPEKKEEIVIKETTVTVEEKTVETNLVKDSAIPTPEGAVVTSKTPAPPVPAAPVKKSRIRTEAELLKHIGKLEKSLVAECKKPADKRDMDKLLAQAKAIDVPAKSRFRPVYDSIVDYINSEIELRNENARTEALVKKALAGSNKPVEVAAEPTAAEPDGKYDLSGRLEISRLWKYGGDRDRQYILRDPKTRDFLGYVSPAKSSIDLAGHVGQIVGVSGSTAYNRTTGGKVLKVARMDIIDASQVEPPLSTLYAQKPPAKAAAPVEPAAPAKADATEPQPIDVAKAETPEAAAPAKPDPAKETSQEVLPIPTRDLPKEEPTQVAKEDDSPQLLVPVIKKPDIESIDVAKPIVVRDTVPIPIEKKEPVIAADKVDSAKTVMDVPEYRTEKKVVKVEPAKKPVMDKPDVKIPKMEIPEEPVAVEKPEIKTPKVDIPAVDIPAPEEAPAEPVVAKKPEMKAPEVKIPEIKAPEEIPAEPVVAKKPELKTPKVDIPKEVSAEPKIVKKPEVKAAESNIPELIPPEMPKKEPVAKADPVKKPSIAEPALPSFEDGPAVKMKSLDSPEAIAKTAAEPKKAAPVEAPVKKPEPVVKETVVEDIEVAAKPIEAPVLVPPTAKKRRTSRSAVSLPGYDKPVQAKATVIEGEFEIEWD